VFAEKGYHAASIDDIIREAGIARGTFYLYFESKRAIFEELLDGYQQRLQGVIRRISLEPGAPSPIAQIRGNVERVLDVLSENRELNRILLRQAEGLDADFTRRQAAFYGEVLARIEGALSLGQQMGVVRPGSVPVLAACVLGSVKEVVNQFLLGAPTGGTGLEREPTVQAIVTYNLQGLMTPLLNHLAGSDLLPGTGS
jgi:AcrR family transcriptional regulator